MRQHFNKLNVGFLKPNENKVRLREGTLNQSPQLYIKNEAFSESSNKAKLALKKESASCDYNKTLKNRNDK